MGTGRARGTVAAWLVGLLLVANGWVWSASLPFGRGPDEFDHFAMVDFIARHGRLPVFGQEPELPTRVAPDGQPVESYAAYPPLPYLLAAALTALPLEPWLAARLLSIFSYAGTALVSWHLARRLAPASACLPLAIPAFVALVPQFSFVGGYLNADALAALLGALTLLALLAGRHAGWRAPYLLALGGLLGLDLLTRYTLFALWPSAGLAVALAPGIWPRRLGRLTLVGVAALVVAAPWLGRNVVLYGEPIPEQVVQAALAAASPDYALSYRARGLSLLDAARYPIWWLETFRSFWAAFDLQRVFLPSAVYYLLFGFTLVGAVGWLADLAARLRARWAGPRDRVSATPEPDPVSLALLALAVTVALGLALWSSWARDPSPQGRYLFPVLPAIAAGLAAGWRRVAGRLVTAWPGLARLAGAGWQLWLGGLLLLNVGSLALVVLPTYFGDGETADAIVTLDAPAPDEPATPPLTLAGWAVARVRPPWSPARLLWPAAFYRPATSLTAAVPGTPLLVSWGSTARPDVARRFGGQPALTPAGFGGTVEDPDLPPGRYQLQVCATAAPAATPTRCASREVTLLPDGE